MDTHDQERKIIYSSKKFFLSREHKKRWRLRSISGEYQAAIYQTAQLEYGVALLAEGKIIDSWGITGNFDIFLVWRATEVLRHMKQYVPTMLRDAYLAVMRGSQDPLSQSTVTAVIGQEVIDSIMNAKVQDTAQEIVKLSLTTSPGSDRVREVYRREMVAKTFTPFVALPSPDSIGPLMSESMLVPDAKSVAVESYRSHLSLYFALYDLSEDAYGRSLIEEELFKLINDGIYVSCQQCPEVLVALAGVRTQLELHARAYRSLNSNPKDSLAIYVQSRTYKFLREAAMRTGAEWLADLDQSKPMLWGLFSTPENHKKRVHIKKYGLLSMLYDKSFDPDKILMKSSKRPGLRLASSR